MYFECYTIAQFSITNHMHITHSHKHIQDTRIYKNVIKQYGSRNLTGSGHVQHMRGNRASHSVTFDSAR